MADLSIKRDTLGPDGDKGDATVGGSGTTLTISEIAREDADVLDVALTGVDYSALGPGDPGEAYEYAALTVRTAGPHFHSPATDRPTYALRVIAEDYDGDGDSNHEHYGIYIRARNAGVGGGGFPGASFGKALHVAEGNAYFEDDVDVNGLLTEGGSRILVNAGFGLSKSTNTVSLTSNLDLSSNGATTLGDFRGKVQVDSTAGTINNLALNADTTILRLTGASTVVLNGITGGVDGRILIIENQVAGSLVLASEAGASTAANRISTPGTLSAYVNGIAVLVYSGTSSRWRTEAVYQAQALSVISSASIGTTLTVSGAATFNGGVTLGDAAADDIVLNGAFYRATSRQLAARNASGGTVGWSVFSNGADNSAEAFDAEYVTGTWAARDTSVAGIVKNGDKLNFIKVSGTSSGSDITTAWASALAAPMAWFDLLTSALTIAGAATFSSSATFNGGATFNTAATFESSLTANGNVTLGNAAADTITVTGHGANVAIPIGRQVITASGTYTPTSGTYKVRLRMVGGGGGSGGSASDGVTTMDVSGGGASGAYLEHWIDPGAAITGGAVSIGAAGTAGASTPASGGTGGDTTVVIQGVTYTAKGGFGGVRGTGITSGNTLRAGGAVQAGSGASSGTPDVVHQQAGKMGMVIGFSSSSSYGGDGGSNPLGSGGQGAMGTTAQGSAGTGYGSGGGGNVSTLANTAGRAGQPGVVIIEEYR